MPIRNCASCGRPMDASLARCPSCGAAPSSVEPDPVGGTMPCPFCKEPVRREAVKCRWCGESIGASKGPGAYMPPGTRPSGPAPRSADGPPPPSGVLPLVLGILGVASVGCPPLVLCAPFAWMTGHSYERDCRALGLEPEGSGKAGKILGIIGTILLVLGCGCGGLWFMWAMAGGLN